MQYPIEEKHLGTGGHTFLFTDLVGFTALAEADGDDRAAEVALEFYDRVRRLLPAHRAHEVKTIGDAVMLRCQDPALAVRLGINIVRELETVPGFPPVRVGIDTGSAAARNGDWYGTTVNITARLCAAAGGGQVLVSEGTLAAAGPLRRVELDERRLHWLKNVTEPVTAALVSSRTCAVSRWRPLRFLKTDIRIQGALP
jgi:adenylate cyclase